MEANILHWVELQWSNSMQKSCQPDSCRQEGTGGGRFTQGIGKEWNGNQQGQDYTLYVN